MKVIKIIEVKCCLENKKTVTPNVTRFTIRNLIEFSFLFYTSIPEADPLTAGLIVTLVPINFLMMKSWAVVGERLMQPLQKKPNICRVAMISEENI